MIFSNTKKVNDFERLKQRRENILIIPIIPLIVKNVDRQWIRHLEPVINQAEIKEVLELLGPLEELQIKMPGLAEEELRRIKIRKPKAPLRRRQYIKIAELNFNFIKNFYKHYIFSKI